MRSKRNGWWIVIGVLAVLMLLAMVAMGAERRPPRRELPRELGACPAGAICGQHPPAGPAFSTDGDPESDAALAEVREVLARRGCQIAVVERVNEDGGRTPALQVERVWYFLAMP